MQTKMLDLPGVTNARQLGGYPAAGGRRVKNGVLLRSGALSDAAPGDLETLMQKYKLSTIIDLRIAEEASRKPDPEMDGVRYYSIPVLEKDRAAAARAAIVDIYRLYGDDPGRAYVEMAKAGALSDEMYTGFFDSQAAMAGFKRMFDILLNQKEGGRHMNDQLKQAMREILLERYGMDINEAKCSYSTQNYAFVFPNKTHMLRVSMTTKKTRREIMAEMLWVDDLKQFKQPVCESDVFLCGNLLEEFGIDGKTYRASMFRTAWGKVEPIVNMTPMLFSCIGDLMGAIHHVSTNEREIGICYQRGVLADQFVQLRERTFPNLPEDVRRRILSIEARVNALPRDLGFYGICHGDFHHHNFFVEANNVWLFDVDGCCYTHYLYDIASFVQACFLRGYRAGEDCRKVLEADILPYFKIGYGLNKACDDHYWKDLELFIEYRTAYSLMKLEEVDDCGVMGIQPVKQFFKTVITCDDIMQGMTLAAG